MTLPWKGGRVRLIAAAANDRKLRLFICCMATLGTVAFSLLNPQIIRYTIDSVIGTVPLDAPVFVSRLIEAMGGLDFIRSNLWICALFIAGAALIAELCNIVRNFTGSEIGETIAWRLLNTLYGHIQKLPWNWHVKCQTGDIIQRCTTDVDNIRNFIQNNLSELLRTICIFVVAVIMMFSMDVFMSLVGLSLIPAVFIFSLFYFRHVSRNFELAEKTESAMQAAAQENYTGVRVVRAFGREDWEMKKFAEKTKAHRNVWTKIGKMLGLFWGGSDILSGLQLAIIVAAGIFRSVYGDLSPGTFLAFYAYCNMMIWPVRQLGRILSDLSRTLVATERLREVLASEPETDSPDDLYPQIKGEISFENVSFSYDDKPILHNISFSLKPGQTLAILGATGSGKSSLIHLLGRLYDLEEGGVTTGVTSGVIKIDGIDIRRIARSHLRKNIGLCLQEPFLFSKTIRENIAGLKPDIDISDIKSSAAIAQVHDSIEGFAQGYDTIIGERGVTLSGGQRQRVAIARTLASNTPVLIFDDSLSAVDTETDARIRAAMRDRVKSAAVIIVSHRISSLMQADKILVLKNGTIEDIGSHKELMERVGTYRRIFEMQASGMTDNGVEENQDG
ncbi:MAG: ABC transporter ATP-binding protein/permease [Treponema sp.]|nr:ABC transporter ATP-binding protein/permease [Treponema sp.]